LIAYDSDIAGPVQVFVMHPDGSHKRRLTHSGQNWEPRWSPDGRRIAYVHAGRSTRPKLWIMNANGRGKRRLTSGPGADYAPRWSPDGQWIAFTHETKPCSPDCRFDIWLIRPDGTGARPLTTNGGSAQPTWSPDGTQIAFDGASADGTRGDLYVMNADGTGAHNLTASVNNPDLDVSYPAWSPDGQWILFAPFGFTGSTLSWISPDGAQAFSISTRNGDDMSEPAWSPDGKWIVFQTQQTLWVTDFATFSKSRRVAFKGDNHNPDWQPLPQSG
jgi:TolB protein